MMRLGSAARRRRPAARVPVPVLVLVPLVVLLLAQAGVGLGRKGPDAEGGGHALQPEGRGVELTLARDGQALYDIVLPATPTPQEAVAAEELSRWLGEMTGGDFAPVSDATGGRHAIHVGRTAGRDAAGLGDPGADLGPEGYAITERDGDLFLAGGAGRGPIFAVMALLEEDLGCRWYTPTVTRIPRTPTLTARIVPRVSNPAFGLRDPFSFVSNDAAWALRNRTNSYNAAVPGEAGGHLNYAPGWFVHTYNQILRSTDENFEACPECFMLDEDGTRSPRQLCPTHPHVVDRAIERVRQTLAEHPGAELISVSQNDIYGYCHCDRCMRLIGPEGSPAAAMLSLVNAVATAIAEAHPDVTVTTLGYQDTVPATKRMRPQPNVAIRLATDVMWGDPFAPAETSPVFMAALDGWGQVAPQIHIWDYQVNFGDYFQPWPSFHAKAQNLRLFARYPVTGVMIQGAYQAPGNERQTERAWVFAKLLWDPARDVWPLMADFVRGVYGPAAPPIEAYDRMLYDCGTQHLGIVDCLGSSDAFVERASALFDEAEDLARDSGDADLLHRVELARLPVTDLAIPLARGRWVASQSDADLAVYNELLADFERVATAAGVRQYSEGTRLQDWLDRRQAFVSAPTPAETRAAEVDGQAVCVQRLPATWKLMRETDAEAARAWSAANLDDSDWGAYRTDLGVGWEDQGYPGTDGAFWFRQTVSVPAACGGEHVYVYARACDEEAWVWVDGQPIGERTVASSGIEPFRLWLEPFALEATGLLTPGAPHQVTLRVHDAGGMGGLYLPVFVVGADVPLTTAQITQAVGVRNPYGGP